MEEWIKKYLVIIVVGVVVVVGIMATFIFGNSKYVKGTVNSLDKMRYMVPEEFELNNSTEDTYSHHYRMYSYKSSDEECRIYTHVYFDEHDIEQWLYSYLERRVDIGTLELEELEELKIYNGTDKLDLQLKTKKINQKDWAIFTLKNEYFYLYEDDTNLYVANFDFVKSNRGATYCSKASNTFTKSLEIK